MHCDTLLVYVWQSINIRYKNKNIIFCQRENSLKLIRVFPNFFRSVYILACLCSWTGLNLTWFETLKTGFVASRSLYTGSYMCAHVLLILINGLGERDQMQGLPSILSLSQQV